jgi:hypothetical protein
MGRSSCSRSQLPRTDNHERGVSKYTARSRRFSQNSTTIGGLSNFNPPDNLIPEYQLTPPTQTAARVP